MLRLSPAPRDSAAPRVTPQTRAFACAEAATGGHRGRLVAAACAVGGAFEEMSRGKFTVDFFFSKKGARESGGHALSPLARSPALSLRAAAGCR